MIPVGKPSFEGLLYAALRSEHTANVLASLPREALGPLARIAREANLLNCATTYAAALRAILGTDGGECVEGAIEHQLWCAREVARRSSDIPSSRKTILRGASHVEEIRAQPTVVLSPMTVPWVVAVDAIRSTFAGKRIVVYGESLPPEIVRAPDIVSVSANLRSLRTIVSELDAGAVFCTYADFVFSGHSTARGALFGRERPFASAFTKLVERPGVAVLPVHITRDVHDDCITITVDEPFEISSPFSHAGRGAVGLHVSERVLEGLIRRQPVQWLLLGSVVAEAIYDPPGSLS